jgi:hypothetical protein
MPQIRVKVDGRSDEAFNTHEKAMLATVLSETMRTVVVPIEHFTPSEKESTAGFVSATLEGYICAFKIKVDQECRGSGMECRLDSIRIMDIEGQAATRVLKKLEEGGVDSTFLELARFAISKFQALSHKKNAELVGKERRGEAPYEGMYW